MEFIYSSEKKKIMERLEYYGITKLPYLLIRFGKEKIRGYSGDSSIEEIAKIDQSIRVEIMGLYLFHEYDEGIRLSLDAIHLLKDQITKNIIELSDEQAKEFLKGHDILLSDKDKKHFFEDKKEKHGFKVIKHKNDFIGSGKLTQERLMNYVPKERRLR